MNIFLTGTTAALNSLNLENDNTHKFVVKGDPTNETEYKENVEWIDLETAPYTWSEVETKKTELENNYNAEQWKRNRKAEYPSHEECIHALLDGGDTLTDLQAKRTATKNKYPKPE